MAGFRGEHSVDFYLNPNHIKYNGPLLSEIIHCFRLLIRMSFTRFESHQNIEDSRRQFFFWNAGLEIV